MSIYDFISSNLNRDSVIFEIGSHMGLDTVKFIELTGSRNIHCFECDPRNVGILKDKNLEIYLNNIAVSNVDGYVDFYQSTGKPLGSFGIDILDENDWTASSSIRKPKDHLTEVGWCKFKDPIKVKSTRIDSYCLEKKISSIDFVWMDVQGAEGDVLSGFGKMVADTKFIFTEYSNKELYEGGIVGKEKILDMLGKNWGIVHDFRNDILLENYKK